MVAALAAAYDPALSRITLTASGLNAATVRTEIYRFEAGESPVLANGTHVRGEDIGAATGGIVHDFEFAAGVGNRYTLYSFDAGGGGLDVAGSDPVSVTPVLDAVWLKSPARPFLNRAVTVTDFSPVQTPARGGVLEVLNRRLPVAITEVRGSRRFDLTLMATDGDEADALELFLSFGDVVFLHVPADCAVPGSLYAYVGDVTRSRASTRGVRRFFTLPLVECAAPDPAIAGYTVTWAGLMAGFADWTAVTAAFPTWLDVMQHVSAPEDEVVS